MVITNCIQLHWFMKWTFWHSLSPSSCLITRNSCKSNSISFPKEKKSRAHLQAGKEWNGIEIGCVGNSMALILELIFDKIKGLGWWRERSHLKYIRSRTRGNWRTKMNAQVPSTFSSSLMHGAEHSSRRPRRKGDYRKGAFILQVAASSLMWTHGLH